MLLFYNLTILSCSFIIFLLEWHPHNWLRYLPLERIFFSRKLHLLPIANEFISHFIFTFSFLFLGLFFPLLRTYNQNLSSLKTILLEDKINTIFVRFFTSQGSYMALHKIKLKFNYVLLTDAI